MITFDEDSDIFSSSKIRSAHFFSGFGTKVLGDAQNVDLIVDFFKKNGVSDHTIVIPKQVHSTQISIVKRSGNQVDYIEASDGLISEDENVILVVKTADCLPVIFADSVRGLYGISHQGWKGTLDGMAVHMVDKMVELGSKKEDIIVAIGPSVNSCCYDILGDRFELFKNKYPSFFSEIIEVRESKMYLNIQKANYLQVRKAGILKENIDYKPTCTQCDGKRFFSRRRDGVKYANMFNFVMNVVS